MNGCERCTRNEREMHARTERASARAHCAAHEKTPALHKQGLTN